MRGPLIFLGVVVLAGGAVLALRSPDPQSTPESAAAAVQEQAPASSPAAALPAGSELPAMTVYRSPTCGCCGDWVEHMREAGFNVEVENVADLVAVKNRLGVPSEMGSCHTAVIGDYLVEGHVPADDVKRLLAEAPAVAGLAVPGMPVGSPGMEVPGQPAQAYEVFAFARGGGATVFARH